MLTRVRSFAFITVAIFAGAACGPDRTTAPNDGRLRLGGASADVANVVDAPILYQQSSTSNFVLASLGDITIDAADDFTVPEGQVWSVKSLVMSGKLFKASVRLSIRVDSGGHPFGGFGTANPTPIAQDPASCCSNVTDYLFTFPRVVTLPAGKYWIEVESSFFEETFSWQVSGGNGSAPLFTTNVGITTWEQAGAAGFAFAVLGTAQLSQTITFGPSTPSAASPGTTATLDVTASSNLPVSLAAGPSNVCTLSGTTLSFVGGGKCTVTANQAGDATHLAAPQATRDINVLMGQTIAFTSTSPSSAYVNGTYAVSANGGASGNPVVVTVGPSNVCTLSGNVVQFVGVGTCSVNANQAGSAAFAPAPQVSQTIKVDYHFEGFSAPVKNDGALNTANAGKTIPLKWRVTDASGAPVTNLRAPVITVSELNCSAGSTANQVEESASGGSGLQNLGNGYYQLNWKTPSSYAKSCKTLNLDLGEGSGARTARFEFTK